MKDLYINRTKNLDETMWERVNDWDIGEVKDKPWLSKCLNNVTVLDVVDDMSPELVNFESTNAYGKVNLHSSQFHTRKIKVRLLLQARSYEGMLKLERYVMGKLPGKYALKFDGFIYRDVALASTVTAENTSRLSKIVDLEYKAYDPYIYTGEELHYLGDVRVDRPYEQRIKYEGTARSSPYITIGSISKLVRAVKLEMNGMVMEIDFYDDIPIPSGTLHIDNENMEIFLKGRDSTHNLLKFFRGDFLEVLPESSTMSSNVIKVTIDDGNSSATGSWRINTYIPIMMI